MNKFKAGDVVRITNLDGISEKTYKIGNTYKIDYLKDKGSFGKLHCIKESYNGFWEKNAELVEPLTKIEQEIKELESMGYL